MGVSAVSDRQDQLQPDQDRSWAEFLSSGAKLREVDFDATKHVMEALNLERESVADGSSWAKYLSGAAQLSSWDSRAVEPVLKALQLERRRVQRWRLNVTRFVAGAMAAAAVVAAVAVFTPNRSADQNDAYAAYQEAARGW